MKVTVTCDFPNFAIRTMSNFTRHFETLDEAAAYREKVKGLVHHCIEQNKLFFCEGEEVVALIPPALLNTAFITITIAP